MLSESFGESIILREDQVGNEVVGDLVRNVASIPDLVMDAKYAQAYLDY